MNTEGVGITAPRLVPVVLTMAELSCLYKSAYERAEHRGYKARADKWGQGIKGVIEINGIGILTKDVRPIFVGLLGEYGVQRYVQQRFRGQALVDLRLLKHGDFGIDLTAYGMKIQVKTRQSHVKHTLYKRANRNGYRFSIPSQTCVFCEWNGGSTVNLLGWQWSKEIESMPLVQSDYGDWWNAVVDDSQLLPMCRMRDELEAWREVQCHL